MPETTTPSGPAPTLEPSAAEPKHVSIVEQTIIGTASGGEQSGDMAIRPFSFRASDEDLADLKRRIVATRWPDRETVDDDSQGVQLATMQKLADYWASEYDWRRSRRG